MIAPQSKSIGGDDGEREGVIVWSNGSLGEKLKLIYFAPLLLSHVRVWRGVFAITICRYCWVFTTMFCRTCGQLIDGWKRCMHCLNSSEHRDVTLF